MTDHLPDKKIKCPYTGFRQTCFDGVTKWHCPKWIHVAGKNPQSDQQIDTFACSDAILPMLLIENAQMERQTGAAVESFRNEMIQLNHGYLEPLPSPRRTNALDHRS